MAVRARWMGWVVLALVAACGGGAGDGGVQDGTARTARAVVPSCSYDHVYVTVEKVVIDQDAGLREVVLPSPRRIDLVGSKGGVLAALGIAPLPAGHYSGVRLVLADNGASGSAMANAVVPTGGAAVPLTTPSAQQSGLKLQVDFDVAAQAQADLTLLAFDPCQSVTRAGNSGRYLLSPVLAAQPIDVSLIAKGEFRVNTTTAGDQDQPQVTPMNDGGYVVTWISDAQGGGGRDVYAQRFDARGSPQGGELRLATGLPDPAVAVWRDGGFVVTWTVYGAVGEIYAQRFDAAGTPVGSPIQASTAFAYSRFSVRAVAALTDGSFVVGWRALNTLGRWALIVRRFDASGTPMADEVQIFDVDVLGDVRGRVFAMPDGGFVVAWNAIIVAKQSREMAVLVQRFDAAGHPVSARTKIASSAANPVERPTVSDYGSPTVAALADGGYVVTWAAGDLDGTQSNVYVQRVDSTGALVGGPLRVNSTTAGNQDQPTIAPLIDGGYLVVWASDGQDGSGYGIVSQRFDAAGNRVGSETLVNSTTALNQLQPAAASVRSGASVVAWASEGQDGSGYGIYAQQFDAQGNAR